MFVVVSVGRGSLRKVDASRWNRTGISRLSRGSELPELPEKVNSIPAYLHCSPALLMEFKHATMASSNNSSSPNGHNSGGSGPAANHQHQSQHITTMSSPQGECGLPARPRPG